jgi:hypothetical protein
MTLLLPPLDQARSYRSLVQRVSKLMPRTDCIAAPGVTRAQAAALEYLGGYRVDAVTPARTTACPYLLVMETRQEARPPGAGWKLLARERRNTSDEEITAVYRRAAPAPRPAP